jgi:hypothetical protein
VGADVSKRQAAGGLALSENITIVRSVDDLNFWLRRFAPRVTLHLLQTEVIATSSAGELRMPTMISFVRDGERRTIVAVGDDRADVPGATTVRLFSSEAMSGHRLDDLLQKFFSLVLQRLPRSPGFIRPVVVVRGLMSLPPEMNDGQQVARALQSCGAAAVVIDVA